MTYRHEIIGQLYTITFEEISISVVRDLFEISPGIDQIITLHSVSISQSSDAGDTESEMLNLVYHRGSTSGSGGVANPLTGAPVLQIGDQFTDNTATVETNNTTQSVKGTVLRSENFNVLLGYAWDPSPAERIVVHPGGRLVIALEIAPSDAVILSGSITIEIIGEPAVGG